MESMKKKSTGAPKAWPASWILFFVGVGGCVFKDGPRHGLSTRADQYAEMVSTPLEETFTRLAHSHPSLLHDPRFLLARR